MVWGPLTILRTAPPPYPRYGPASCTRTLYVMASNDVVMASNGY